MKRLITTTALLLLSGITFAQEVPEGATLGFYYHDDSGITASSCPDLSSLGTGVSGACYTSTWNNMNDTAMMVTWVWDSDTAQWVMDPDRVIMVYGGIGDAGHYPESTDIVGIGGVIHTGYLGLYDGPGPNPWARAVPDGCYDIWDCGKVPEGNDPFQTINDPFGGPGGW